MVLTREQAATAAAAAVAERDGISANLLDLDGSFGKRLLEGAVLTGESKARWEQASGELAALWETFTAYSAVVDMAADLSGRAHRSSSPELEKTARLLGGPSVQLTRAPQPLGRRDLTETGQEMVSLATAVARMRRSFASVTEVVTAAEAVWNQIAGPLADIGTALETATRRAEGLGDPDLTWALSAASAELASLRGVLNGDPLSLWRDGQVSGARLERLRRQADEAASRAQAVAAIRDDAQRRISAARSAVAAAEAAWQAARTARDQTAVKIVQPAGPVAASQEGQRQRELAGLAQRAAALDSAASAGRWAALATEIEAIELQAADVAEAGRASERAAAGLLARRDELRGLLDAYQVKAARLGGAEDTGLTERYRQAHDLLWTAPCDLDAAAVAVTSYQQAISALEGQGRTR